MKGEAAKENMPELDFDGAFYWSRQGYPILRIAGIRLGDVDGDMEGNAQDAAALRKYLLGTERLGLTDLNSDGQSDLKDLIRLKKILTGEESEKKNS